MSNVFDPADPGHFAPCLTREVVATRLNISERKLDRMRKDGEIAWGYVGRQIRFRPVDVIAYESKQFAPHKTSDEIDEYLDRIVSVAPRLSAAQRDRIAALIGGAA